MITGIGPCSELGKALEGRKMEEGDVLCDGGGSIFYCLSEKESVLLWRGGREKGEIFPSIC